MLTEEEEAFIIYWKSNREKQKRTFRQFLMGIPIALLFVIPIGLNFFSGWYKRASMMSSTSDFSPGILLLALLLIVVFIAIFSRKFKWDQYEQRYIELMAKKKRQEDGKII
jgi:membrane protein YdbS with pleckstrin-like domain